jgi:hypothetical protein
MAKSFFTLLSLFISLLSACTCLPLSELSDKSILIKSESKMKDVYNFLKKSGACVSVLSGVSLDTPLFRDKAKYNMRRVNLIELRNLLSAEAFHIDFEPKENRIYISPNVPETILNFGKERRVLKVSDIVSAFENKQIIVKMEASVNPNIEICSSAIFRNINPRGAILLSLMRLQGFESLWRKNILRIMQPKSSETLFFLRDNPTLKDLHNALLDMSGEKDKGYFLNLRHPSLANMNMPLTNGKDTRGNWQYLKKGPKTFKQMERIFKKMGFYWVQDGYNITIAPIIEGRKSSKINKAFEMVIATDKKTGKALIDYSDKLNPKPIMVKKMHRGKILRLFASSTPCQIRLNLPVTLATFASLCAQERWGGAIIDLGPLKSKARGIYMEEVLSQSEKNIINILDRTFKKNNLEFHADVLGESDKISIIPGWSKKKKKVIKRKLKFIDKRGKRSWE